MDADVTTRTRWRWLVLALLGFAALARAYHWTSPLVDNLSAKQVHNANKVRHFARSPGEFITGTYDFLDRDGHRQTLVEEFPLYAALVATTYRIVGPNEWLGRAWSLLATLVSLAALLDLFRREFDARMALASAFLLAASPLLIFYGRAFFPDPWMIACMLVSAWAYRRCLDEGGSTRWWLVAAGAGALAPLFKYFGLMVLIPLAEMTHRREGWRGWFRPRFAGLAAAMMAPVGIWILAVFARYPNPTSRTSYFLFQQPGILVLPRLYERFLVGFLLRDVGPFGATLAAVGVASAIRGRVNARPLLGWTAMGLLFYLLLAPKVVDHDYYGLLLLPAAAGWGGIGAGVILRALPAGRRARPALVVALVALVAAVQSPLVMGEKFEQEVGHLVVAGRVRELCAPSDRVVILGRWLAWPALHYSEREGWVELCGTLPPDWKERLAHYHALGAEYVAIFFDPTVPREVRSTFDPLIRSLPRVEHRSGPWFRKGGPCEYYLFRLRGAEAQLAFRNPRS